ncbi:MAG: polyprenyl synthetase family protein [Ruminococcaceae bacterium]|nr:polyprenyl synthetase family protein [Oscillospiraceae bacterium]
MSFKELLKSDLEIIERELEKYFEVKDEAFPHLFESMKYTTMAGGKRIRAFLVMMFARLSGGSVEAAIPFACAIEMIQAYTLIHDDLPCMDDDDMRRGKPSNHIVFGEAQALLAGDALLTYAFEVCADNKHVSPSNITKAVSILAKCIGACGTVGGQVLDLEGEKRKLTKEELYHVHDLKTSALIQASALLGCCTSDKGREYFDVAKKYGHNIGIAFQVIDDILDVISDEETLGKPIGSDAESNKTTFLDFYSIEDAKKYAEAITEEACNGLGDGDSAKVLKELAYYLLERTN